MRASLQAWESDQKAARGEGFVTYPAHDLQMLVYAASMDGQSSLAIQAGRGFAKLTGDPMYSALALLRFGRFDDVAGIGERPPQDVSAGIWDFAQGYAQLRHGNLRGARQACDRVLAAAQSSTAAFKIHPAKALLGTLAGILDGELELAAGDRKAALAAFERAVSLEDSLLVDDPEPLPFAASIGSAPGCWRRAPGRCGARLSRGSPRTPAQPMGAARTAAGASAARASPPVPWR